MRMKFPLVLGAAAAAFFIASSALAQNAGTVTNHAFVLGKGAGKTGYTSLLCGSAQLAVGQAAADPICQTITGDVTISAGGVTAIGATKVTSAMLNADVFSTAHTWAGQQSFVAPILGTPASATLTNATGLPISTGVSGLAAGIASWLATPSSANLRGALTDETGTGLAYFQGGDIGTPSAGVLTNATGLPVATGISGLSAGVATFLATPSSANLRAALTDETGTGAAYFAGGALGTPLSATLTNATGLPTTGLTGTLQAAQEPAHTGDVTNAAGSLAMTLAAGNAGNLNSGTLLAARMPALTGDCTTSVGTVATTCTKINGVDQTTSWTTYTPTVTSGSGTPTTVSAAGRYKQIGKTIFLSVTVTVTSVGTAAGVIYVTLPTNSSTAGSYIGTGYEYITTGNTGAAAIVGPANATRVQTAQYNGTTFWVNGYTVAISVTYETP